MIDAFRLINPHTVISGREPRQTTSNIGHINKPSIQALIHGLNRHYYSIAVNYRKTDLEQSMLMNLHKRNWTEGLKLRDFRQHKESNEVAIKVRYRPLWPKNLDDESFPQVYAYTFRSIQQVRTGRIHFDCRSAENAARGETGPKTSSGGSRRKGDG